jgi:hypothetical protein
MSIENFINIYPADRLQLRDILERQKQRETNFSTKANVALLAYNLAREGGDGLRDASRRLLSSSTTMRYTPNDLLKMPDGTRQELLKSWAEIICGISIYAIDDTIWNKTFSYDLVAGLNNTMARGTPFVPLRVQEVKEEAIPDDKWRSMVGLAGKDKTLTSFFQNDNMHLMPNGLRRLVEQMYVLPLINSDVIPVFRPRAQLLVS